MASVARNPRLPGLAVAPPEQASVRRLTWATLITSCGNGAWYTCWALFLTRSVKLSPAQVGIGITIAGAIGLLASAPLGMLADRFGTTAVLVPLLLLQAAGFVAYLAVRDFWAFLLVACATVAADRGSIGLRSALALRVSGSQEPLQTLATVRVAGSGGFALGSALGAVAVALDSRTAYIAVPLVNAGSFLVYALTVTALPCIGKHPLPRPTATAALRDLPYLTLAAIAGVLALCWGMLSSGLPLWVARHTLAPLWISAVIVVFNALTITVLQVPITRGVSSPLRAARTARLAGAALALSCVLFALSQGRGGTLALLVLFAAATVHVAGELLFVAASWRLSVDLMPADAPAQYQGVFATGQATAQMIAPAVMTTLVIGWSAAGWLILASVFTIAVLPAMPATRWALRTRRTQATANEHEAISATRGDCRRETALASIPSEFGSRRPMSSRLTKASPRFRTAPRTQRKRSRKEDNGHE